MSIPEEFQWHNVIGNEPIKVLCVGNVHMSGFNKGNTYSAYGLTRQYIYLWNACDNYVRAPRKWFRKVVNE